MFAAPSKESPTQFLVSIPYFSNVFFRIVNRASPVPDVALTSRAGFRHVEAPGQPSVVDAHPTLNTKKVTRHI